MRFMWFIHVYNLVALKSFIITSGSFDQRKCLGNGREAYDSPQTFVVLRGYVCICVGIYVSYIYIHIYIYHIYVHGVIQATGSFARQDFGRAIRGRNTNSPNTINYLPRNILSFCFTSRLRGRFLAPTYFSISFLSISILNHHTRRPLRFLSHVCEYCDSTRVTNQHIYDHHRWF